MIVDDDAAIRALLSEALGFEGYAIETAGTAREALAAVGRQAPDLILLDMRMPDDGPRFEAELRKRSLNAPIIATSASAEGPKWAARIGVRFLPKPFDLGDLRTAVESAVNGAQM